MLSYHNAASNKISRLLIQCDMKTHVKKTTQGKIGMKTPDVWCIPCGCEGCTSDKQEFRNQMQGAHKAPFPGPAKELSCSKHILGTGWHEIQHYRMATVERCCDCLVKEVNEIQLHPTNFNRDGRFMRSRTRQLMLQQVWNTSSENWDQTQQYFTPFPWVRKTVITTNIPTTWTAYTVLLYSDVKYSDVLCILCTWCLVRFVWPYVLTVRKLLRFTQHVSGVILVEHHERLCFIVPSFEAGTILLLKMCHLFLQWNTWDGFCVIGCGIYVQFSEFYW